MKSAAIFVFVCFALNIWEKINVWNKFIFADWKYKSIGSDFFETLLYPWIYSLFFTFHFSYCFFFSSFFCTNINYHVRLFYLRYIACAFVQFTVIRRNNDLKSLLVFTRANDDGEVYMKTLTDCWVVGRKSDQRELYVIINQKNANLIDVNGKYSSARFGYLLHD